MNNELNGLARISKEQATTALFRYHIDLKFAKRKIRGYIKQKMKEVELTWLERLGKVSLKDKILDGEEEMFYIIDVSEKLHKEKKISQRQRWAIWYHSVHDELVEDIRSLCRTDEDFFYGAPRQLEFVNDFGG